MSAAKQLSMVRLNQIQVVGSHNSFHLEVTPEEKVIRQAASPETEMELEYTASKITEQLGSQKVRQLEFDVYADPNGGLYANPLLRQLAGLGPYEQAMQLPGTKVLHAQDIDYYTRCLTLIACLREVKAWSDRNPWHITIAIMLEFSDEPLTRPGDPNPVPGTVIPLEWTRSRMLALEQEILSVFPRNRLVTPDSVRRPGMTLEKSLQTYGWPLVDQTRGKILLMMDQGGKYRDAYIQGNPSLEGRLLFTNSFPGQPDAAFMKRYTWDAGGVAEITNLVRSGYMVRTRADANTVQARNNDTTDRDIAFATGAQWVSTDYPAPGMAARFGSLYYVAIPGGTIARCNPLTSRPGCDSRLLEPIRKTS
ncbi:MAG TPA: phosphatidylinositol-specific phospholipase C1-like protein [Actinophytocola sp.]|uniref:phosphatidylinositol-specific phospholipase C1-like protein n=1 Tax=Actinophytocola sp. TaxID=1872138 RepID=UPI002DB8353B|nr:phosphatidylinositol-specific phospholipase C1-like protein [Actinophytocola sp.]HEU5471214.1 phosphatidylinositol-specific phospholipase C1-like protein [Actinophytocola sp.]